MIDEIKIEGKLSNGLDSTQLGRLKFQDQMLLLEKQREANVSIWGVGA